MPKKANGRISLKTENQKPYSNVTPVSILGQNRGQLIVEYILLIVLVVAIATTLTRSLVGRGEGETGVIITKWAQLLEMVGQDIGD